MYQTAAMHHRKQEETRLVHGDGPRNYIRVYLVYERLDGAKNSKAAARLPTLPHKITTGSTGSNTTHGDNVQQCLGQRAEA